MVFDAEKEYDKVFDEEYRKVNAFSSAAGISVRRLNELFHEGSLSAAEHGFLVEKLFLDKKVSVLAVAALVISILNWILILKFNYYGDEYQLLSGEARYYVSLMFAPVALILSVLAIREIKRRSDKNGLEMAVAAFTLATGILTVTFPIFLLKVLG